MKTKGIYMLALVKYGLFIKNLFVAYELLWTSL